ncbi:MAG: EVE domain-containing protein, partial [bacterium]|nr:EVE domain-containing protein [bacterium]
MKKPTYYLAKTHPEDYSVEDLANDGATEWDGVKNPQAVRTIRQMRPGDRVFIYHSGGVSAVVGLAEVSLQPRQDPDEPKSWV